MNSIRTLKYLMITDKIIYLISQEFFRNGKKTLIINIFYKSLQKVAKELNISIDKLLIKIFFLYFPFLPFKIRQIKVKSGKIKKHSIVKPLETDSKTQPIKTYFNHADLNASNPGCRLNLNHTMQI